MARAKGQGRKPKPTVLKLLHGTARKDRINPKEPKLKPEKCLPPPGLTELGKEFWDEIGEELFLAGLLTRLDRHALAVLAEAYGRWRFCQREIEKHGMFVKHGSKIYKDGTKSQGYVVLSPYLTVANKMFEQLARMFPEFGLTPSSRTRVSAADTGDLASDFDKFINEK